MRLLPPAFAALALAACSAPPRIGDAGPPPPAPPYAAAGPCIGFTPDQSTVYMLDQTTTFGPAGPDEAPTAARVAVLRYAAATGEAGEVLEVVDAAAAEGRPPLEQQVRAAVQARLPDINALVTSEALLRCDAGDPIEGGYLARPAPGAELAFTQPPGTRDVMLRAPGYAAARVFTLEPPSEREGEWRLDGVYTTPGGRWVIVAVANEARGELRALDWRRFLGL